MNFQVRFANGTLLVNTVVKLSIRQIFAFGFYTFSQMMCWKVDRCQRSSWRVHLILTVAYFFQYLMVTKEQPTLLMSGLTQLN